MSKYDFPLEMEGNNAPKLIAEQIRENSLVLELGPANGRLTQYLANVKNCTVDIVEIDAESGADAAKFARRCCLGPDDGNLEKRTWFHAFSDERYDAIVLADVLEHLHDPQEVLALAVKLLKPAGKLWISVPNLAHNSVLIELINNRFFYNQVGLLDSTHIHFFTYDSLVEMIHKSGLRIEKQRAVYMKVAENEIPATYDDLDSLLQPGLRKRPGGNIYQFVFCLSIGEETEKDLPKIESVEGFYEESEWEAVCYICEQGDSEFQEEKSVRVPLFPGVNELEFDLCGFKNIKKLRFDPLNYPCMVRVREAWLSDGEVEIIPQNGVRLSDGWLVFDDPDPITLVEIPDRTFDKLRIFCEYYVSDLFVLKKLREMTVEKDAELKRQGEWLDQLKVESDAKDDELARRTEWLDQLRRESEEKDAELERQREWLDQLKVESDAKDNELARRTEWLNQLRRESEEKDAELKRQGEWLDQLKVESDVKANELARLTEWLDQLRRESEEKDAELKRQGEWLDQLKVESDAKANQLARLTEWLDQLRRESEEKDAELKWQGEWLDQLKVESDGKDNELARLTEWLNQLRRESEEKDAELKRQTEWIAQLGKQAAQKDSEISAQKARIGLLESASNAKNDEISRQCGRIERLSKESEEMSVEIERLGQIENSVFGKLYHCFYKG